MLLCVGVALAPALKMKFWNIGAEGQILLGGIVSAACMIYLGDKIPTWLLLLVMFIGSVIGGALSGFIPAAFKAKWGTNETLFTLMMNYVAIQLTSFFVTLWENPFGSNTVAIINQSTKSGWFPEIFGQAYMLNVIIVMTVTVGMFIYLKYSKQGYEISVIGESAEHGQIRRHKALKGVYKDNAHLRRNVRPCQDLLLLPEPAIQFPPTRQGAGDLPQLL